MCGLVGIVAPTTHRLALPDRVIEAMRDALAHRGPDGQGLWRTPFAALAHRRLAVIDPTPAGAQPFVSGDGRYALVYNGELYNDAELRAQLATDAPGPPVAFRTNSDTETLLHALIRWGPAALPRLRGMFAFAFLDAADGRLLLARDPLGIKPLYTWLRTAPEGHAELAFASEPHALAHHPDFHPRPDPVAVSAYLTTIRLTLGRRTLLAGVETLLPGEARLYNLNTPELRRTVAVHPPRWAHAADDRDAPSRLRAALEDSLDRHLRSDVPLCALLSGGIDSTALAALAARRHPDLRTYCSGAAPADDPASASGDLAFARRAAEHLRIAHTEAPVTRAHFARRWPEMVEALGAPLGTPNEVAINQVARTLRSTGAVVAISGEGADELLAGYDAPIVQALQFERTAGSINHHARGLFQLGAAAWLSPALKPRVLQPGFWRSAEHDAHLQATYQDEFAALAAEREPADADRVDAALQLHLRFHRRINLAGLLARLDTATMLASVEGRTPFADVAVADLCESLPWRDKFDERAHEPRTKLALRRGVADLVPAEVLARPKASFPLPFQSWIADHADQLRRSRFVGELVQPAALAEIAAAPGSHWTLAWPLLNLAFWARRWGF